jgi:hypothetical protein
MDKTPIPEISLIYSTHPISQCNRLEFSPHQISHNPFYFITKKMEESKNMEVVSGTLFSMEERIRIKLLKAGATSHEKAVTAQADLDMQEGNWILHRRRLIRRRQNHRKPLLRTHIARQSNERQMHRMRKHLQNRNPKHRRRRRLPNLRSQLQSRSQRRKNNLTEYIYETADLGEL